MQNRKGVPTIGRATVFSTAASLLFTYAAAANAFQFTTGPDWEIHCPS